jgi:23S rRNA (adenine-N6)-dimethyltransferase
VPAFGPAPPSRRQWGWHPLTDEWAARIVEDAAVTRGQLVLDLGAGHGSLTSHLVAAGARVIAVELHPARAERLRRRFVDDQVTVVEADVRSLRLPSRPFRVVANPPFAATGALLHLLLARRSQLQAADLVLQRGVVRRYSTGAAPGERRWRRDFDVRSGRMLPRAAFRPAPRVDAAVLVIRRRRGRRS